MKSDYNLASADMSPRTLTEIRRGSARPRTKGKCISCLYLIQPQPSTKLTPSELEQARQQAARYFRR